MVCLGLSLSLFMDVFLCLHFFSQAFKLASTGTAQMCGSHFVLTVSGFFSYSCCWCASVEDPVDLHPICISASTVAHIEVKREMSLTKGTLKHLSMQMTKHKLKWCVHPSKAARFISLELAKSLLLVTAD